MSNIWINETWVNATEHYGMGESGVYETFTDNRKVLFRFLQKQYGRCVSSMYIDREGKPAMRIGWVFLKRARYEDTRQYYLQETWVSLHERAPKTHTTYYHMHL